MPTKHQLMGIRMSCHLSLAATVMFAILALPVAPAHAQTIIDEWTSVKVPPPPQLKPVAVDPKTTALLMLDFMNQNCGNRPRCVASIPKVKKLLDEARAANVVVVYAIITGTTPADVIKDVAPTADEPWIRSGADKFINTDLEKILKDKGVQTVIVTGTASNAAVLFTAAGAAQRGMDAIVPVDGMSGIDAYADLTTAYMIATAPVISVRSTLTKIDMIKF
jgi:nicotinamidase-related amidase